MKNKLFGILAMGILAFGSSNAMFKKNRYQQDSQQQQTQTRVQVQPQNQQDSKQRQTRTQLDVQVQSQNQQDSQQGQTPLRGHVQSQNQRDNVSLDQFGISIGRYEAAAGHEDWILRSLLGTAANLIDDPDLGDATQAVVNAADDAINAWINLKTARDKRVACQDYYLAKVEEAKQNYALAALKNKTPNPKLTKQRIRMAMREKGAMDAVLSAPNVKSAAKAEDDAINARNQALDQFNMSKDAFKQARNDFEALRNQQHEDNADASNFLTQTGNFANALQLNNNNNDNNQ